MPQRFNNYFYGNQNATIPRRRSSEYDTGVVDYTTMYNQARTGNFGNLTANQPGFAASSSDWLRNYSLQNQQAQMAGASPVTFNALNLADQAMMSTEIANTGGRTITEIGQEAELAEQARLLQLRDQQRQFTQQQGGDMYSQAMMAMEQQRALSDTRGLSAGAAVGAEQMLSATQQMALNQIQGATMDQLMQIDAASLEDNKIAQAAGMRAIEIAEQTDPRFAQMRNLLRNVEVLEATGQTEKALETFQEANLVEAEIYGFDPTNANPALAWDNVIQKEIAAINRPEESDAATRNRNLMLIGGAVLAVAGIALTVYSGGAATPLGAKLTVKGAGLMTGALGGAAGYTMAGVGKAALGYGLKVAGGVITKAPTRAVLAGVALVGWQSWQAWVNRQRNWSADKKQQAVDEYLENQIAIWRNAEEDEEEIQNRINLFKESQLLPALR
jgi:hypothetical protein